MVPLCMESGTFGPSRETAWGDVAENRGPPCGVHSTTGNRGHVLLFLGSVGVFDPAGRWLALWYFNDFKLP
jgi:hypothetical protein